ncbi:hypothetical protein W7Y_0226 [Bifidobacterium animalis subsp. lactis B420]|nr:hypothetical protein W7Y_0226 [Bifidobacterium animalis subsp. lactis B420]AFJ17550.1 hypothetical protein W91_0234 [Bifidobacterium animalis subsp. lactis Bi-07]
MLLAVVFNGDFPLRICHIKSRRMSVFQIDYIVDFRFRQSVLHEYIYSHYAFLWRFDSLAHEFYRQPAFSDSSWRPFSAV